MTERPFPTETSPAQTTATGFNEPTFDDGVADGAEYPNVVSPVAAQDSPSVSGGAPQRADQSSGDTKQVVAGEAASVAADAKDGGLRVAETAASEVKDVASEATAQLRQLVDQLRSEFTEQASGQSERAASGLRSLADELREMTSGTQQSGVATDLARQASDRARGFADWLDDREPGDLVTEARDFARRRPGTFLAAAALLGVLGGRLTRGLTGGEESADPARTVGSPVSTSRVSVAPSNQSNGSSERPTGEDASWVDTGTALPAPGYTTPGREGDISGYEGSR